MKHFLLYTCISVFIFSCKKYDSERIQFKTVESRLTNKVWDGIGDRTYFDQYYQYTYYNSYMSDIDLKKNGNFSCKVYNDDPHYSGLFSNMQRDQTGTWKLSENKDSILFEFSDRSIWFEIDHLDNKKFEGHTMEGDTTAYFSYLNSGG